jgi:hypothetical protein
MNAPEEHYGEIAPRPAQDLAFMAEVEEVALAIQHATIRGLLIANEDISRMSQQEIKEAAAHRATVLCSALAMLIGKTVGMYFQSKDWALILSALNEVTFVEANRGQERVACVQTETIIRDLIAGAKGAQAPT